MRQVLVAGASSDIGLAVCERYLAEGWSVLAHHRTLRPELARLTQDQGERIRTLQLDFEDPEELESGLATHRDWIAASAAFVNCAAILEPTPFSKVTAAAFLKHFTVNTIPGILLMRDLAPAMAARGWGRIVHLSSIGVKFGGGGSSFPYALSKHCIEYLPADHKAWAENGVFVNVLRVGVTDTRFHRQYPAKDMAARIAMIPAKRMATPAEISDAIYWLGSDRNAFITGQTVTAAGGE